MGNASAVTGFCSSHRSPLLLNFMTVATLQSPAKKTTRKTRTRKTTTAKKPAVRKSTKATAQVKSVSTKYQQPVEIKKVTETKSVKVRPAKPNLTFADYTADVKVRWEIHQWETQELWNDIVKGYNNTKPFVIKSVDYVKESYNRAFN